MYPPNREEKEPRESSVPGMPRGTPYSVGVGIHTPNSGGSNAQTTLVGPDSGGCRHGDPGSGSKGRGDHLLLLAVRPLRSRLSLRLLQGADPLLRVWSGVASS